MKQGTRWQLGGMEQSERPSRSQKKRESTALQYVGARLVRMAPSSLAAMRVPDALRKALLEYAGMSSREAKRRHMQYIGRLMREAQEDGSLAPLLEDLGRL